MGNPVLAGKYELLRKLAAGGMAEVFLARQTGVQGFEKLVVIKRILPHLTENEAFVRMFLDEARTAADLRHPNVVSILEIGQDNGRYFIAMEYLHGQDLRRMANRALQTPEMRVPLPLALQVVIDAAAGLHYAHTKTDLHKRPLNIIHRDISPHNIIVTYEGVTKIVDFGVAKAATQTEQTSGGVLKGKYGYMSPEQASCAPMDHRSDQFALGIVLYELCTTERLFKRENEILTLHAVLECNIPSLCDVISGFPADLERIVFKALSRNPEDRFQDCQQFLMALEESMARNNQVHSPARVSAYMKHIFKEALEMEEELGTQVVPGNPRAEETALSAALETQGQATTLARSQVAREGSQPSVSVVSVVSQPSHASGSNSSVGDTSIDVKKTNLPPEMTGFVGRQADLDALADLFSKGHRLVTVLGPGGIGKSRLCAHYAALHQDDYCNDGGGGVWLCDLTEARTLEDICGVVGRALEVALTAGRTSADMVNFVGNAIARRGKTLLLLENFEQVVDFGPATLGRFMALAPKAHFLVSSRELLKLPGEIPHGVSPLGLPDAASDIASSEAVQLFVARARSVRQQFTLSAAEAPLVAQIVRELEGIPLAIELAAARMGVLSAAKLLERLPRRFDLLTGPKRDAASGRQTLRGAIDWSWNLLNPVEQSALAQCSVFRGDFSLEAAEEVLDLSGHESAPFSVDVLEALRDKSLLRTFESKHADAEIRFGLYVTIREYAAEKLAQSGLQAATVARHAAYYLKVGVQWADATDGAGGMDALRRIAQEQENLIQVHRGAVATVPPTSESATLALRALWALDPVLSTRGPFAAHLTLLEQALSVAGKVAVDASLHARVLEARGRVHHLRGRMADSLADYELGLEKARAVKDLHGEALILNSLGKLQQDLGKKTEGRQMHQASLDTCRRIGHRTGEGRALQQLGGLAHDEGDLPEARRIYEETLAIARSVGDRRTEGHVLYYLGILSHELHELTPARRFYEKALTIFVELEATRLRGVLLGYLGFLHQDIGNLDKARQQYERALVALREVADTRFEGIFLASLGGILAAQGHTDQAREALDGARHLLQTVEDPIFLAAVDLQQGHLDLAMSRRALLSGDHKAAAQHIHAVQARIHKAETRGPADAEHPEGTPAVATQTDETRFALRFLKRALEAQQAGA